jgi:hypothetical protein
MIFSLLVISTTMMSCTKENNAPTAPSNFSVDFGGSSTEFHWIASTDADGDAITYDISVLDDANSTPKSIAIGVTTNTYSTTASIPNIPKTMIVTAKDGKGGTTTGVENPDITL